MTPIETSLYSPDQIENMTEAQKADLPTIIEVLEYISSLENATMRRNLQTPGMEDLFREDKYAVVSDHAWTNIPKLYPCSQSMFTLMRGQNNYFSKCYPSLFRTKEGMSEDDHWLISRLQSCEFIAIMLRHPVVRALQQLCQVEYMSVAQHYGFPTEYMDITNQKWAAAFFACTEYKEGNYVPFVPKGETKIGVVYIGGMSEYQMSPDNVKALGFHYFERPTRQNALVYQMKRGDNFDADPFFKRIIFRHDAEASKLVFRMACNQYRYFPKDDWAEIAERIRKPDYPICKAAIEVSRNYGVTLSEEEIQKVLSRNNIRFVNTDIPQAMPTEKQVEWECKKWQEYIFPNLRRNVLQFPPVYKI